MSPLSAYLHSLHEIHATGASVPETSYYGALETLLNEIGKTLKPRVRCVINLANRGAGIPDGGLFTAEQFQRGNAVPLPGQAPARGVIEVKPPRDDLAIFLGGAQVARYRSHYRQVLVTNYREFALLGTDAAGAPILLERYSLAESESAFWMAAAKPQATVALHGERFGDYLKRVLLHAAPLASAQDLAWFLGSYAREARARVERHATLPALHQIREALQQALGITFEADQGAHFFQSTLVQTLFYGVFAAWLLWHKADPRRSDRFDWRTTQWWLRVPVISTLFEQVGTPSKLGPLDLVEVLDWTAIVLNRVDRPAFFESFAEGQAVQYFYEPFLQAFDPQLRKELGVWYTPPEIVRYMVARVDVVLREELGIADGLADSRVYVLDPCCGTGAYLVETLRFVAERLRESGGDALLAHDLKQAAMTRVFGFEIMPAPFVVAHLQLGLLLQTLGAPLDEAQQERVAVYLTNALTGWESLEQPKQYSLLPELEQERTTASRMKQQAPILVVLGNPPYNGYAGVAVAEERDLSTAYRATQRAPAPQGQGLNDLYVRFFRMAERRIVEMSKRGVVCFISNYSWLDGLSFTGMRERYLTVFDKIFIDCLNGDKYKTGKLTPEGDPDPSIFSTKRNREGIQVGTAITLLVRRDAALKNECVYFRHFWGRTKREVLADAARHHPQTGYDVLTPALELGLPFMPTRTQAAYTQWLLLPDLFPASFPGVKTSRDDFLVDIDRDRLLQKMMIYFDLTISHETIRRQYPGIMTDNARFRTEAARDILRQRGFLPDKIIRYAYRPFDIRWLYWEPETKLLDEKRSDYFMQVFEGNCWIEARQRQPFDNFDRGYFSRVLADNFGNGLSNFFPLFLKNSLSEETHPNLSPKANAYLQNLGATAESLFFHTLAILHAPAYRQENAGALRQDWPRIPLPASREQLETSAALGRQLAALLDAETSVPGVTSGAIRPELRALAVLAHIEPGKPLDPATGDLDLNAGWGHAGKGGVTMPGRGKLTERDYTPAEYATLGETAASLGERTDDVFLNDRACWRNIPTRVWNYTLGGYQVIKKWLSYREKALLGRSLKPEEARTVTQIARRIAAIVLMEAELDRNYRAAMAAESDLKFPPSLPPTG